MTQDAATTSPLRALSLTGRCADGAERGKGTLRHAVADKSWAALCGAKPGRLSAGWNDFAARPVEETTCPRCLKKLERTTTSEA